VWTKNETRANVVRVLIEAQDNASVFQDEEKVKKHSYTKRRSLREHISFIGTINGPQNAQKLGKIRMV
jgi:hypothetical protein